MDCASSFTYNVKTSENYYFVLRNSIGIKPLVGNVTMDISPTSYNLFQARKVLVHNTTDSNATSSLSLINKGSWFFEALVILPLNTLNIQDLPDASMVLYNPSNRTRLITYSVIPRYPPMFVGVIIGTGLFLLTVLFRFSRKLQKPKKRESSASNYVKVKKMFKSSTPTTVQPSRNIAHKRSIALKHFNNYDSD